MDRPKLKKIEHKKWKYELEEDWVFYISKFKNILDYSFATEKDGQCIEWLCCKRGYITIKKGYATDGCSCSPDFDSALPGCLAHDALRQACRMDKECPWTSKDSDNCFYEVMKLFRFGFLGRWSYYFAVRGPIGWLYKKFGDVFNPPKDKVCKIK